MGKTVGYCMSSILKSALEWMDGKSVNIKRIVVAAGNEDILSFYENYGFFIEHITLRHK